MRKKLLTALTGIATMTTLLCGCGAKDTATTTEAATEATTATVTEATTEATTDTSEVNADGETTYKSPDGIWEVTYNPEDFLVNEDYGDDAIAFNYLGECGGTTDIVCSYVADSMPDEVLYEMTYGYDEDDIIRYESYFGTEAYWSHTRTIVPENTDTDAGDVVYVDYTAIEHNGGTFVIETTAHGETSEEVMTTISDKITTFENNIVLIDHEPQTEYAYMVGTYEYVDEDGNTETITLNEDHSCTASLDEELDGNYTGTQFNFTDDVTYEFTVEGDSLMLNDNGTWITFDRVTDAK